MSGLAALLAGHTPPDVYQWHSAAHVEDVQHAVEHAGWRFHYLDGWTIEDKESFLKAVGVALDLPEDRGDDLEGLSDKLAECVADDCQGIVLMWDGWSPLARRDDQVFQDALQVLRGRVDAEGGGRFAVILRGDGPSLSVPELPVKH